MPTPDKNDDQSVSSKIPPPPPSKTLPRRNSLHLSTTLHIPIPPSLRRSPYLSSSSSVFNRGLASPTIPTEEDEKWLQDTIPLHSRHHEQAGSDRAGVVTSEQGDTTHPPPPRHRIGIAVPTPRFIPPSLVILDSNWTGLCRTSRRWSAPLCPPNSKQDIYHVEELIR